ncbi:MAG: 2-oxo-4-hydroxy-4-carboxy-5-ureidoimidazoline decarboxylase [Nocardioidaceae bacterium]
MQLDEFNAAPRPDAIATLLPCADIPRWAAQVVDGRPYASLSDLVDRASAAAQDWTITDVDTALAAHPRIGERPEASTPEASMSRAEQPVADPESALALAEGNAEYEAKFGRIFLIRARGRTAAEIVAQLRQRLTNSPADEEFVVTGELRQIALHRLEGLFTP